MPRTTALRRVALCQLAWWTAWAGAQFLAERWGDAGRSWSLMVFTVGYVALTGIALPLAVARSLGLQRRQARPEPRGRRWAGTAALVLLVVVGVVGGGSLRTLAADVPTPAGILRYLLLFVPMALGVTLQSFYLVPRAVEQMLAGHAWARPVAVLSAAASAAVGFWADQQFRSPDLAVVQFGLGLLAGTGAVLTRSIPLTYGAYLVVMLANTLAEAKYFRLPWAPLVIGAVLSAVVVTRWRVSGPPSGRRVDGRAHRPGRGPGVREPARRVLPRRLLARRRFRSVPSRRAP